MQAKRETSRSRRQDEPSSQFELNDKYYKGDKLKWEAEHVERIGEIKNIFTHLVGKPAYHYGDLGVDGNIILTAISEKLDMMWAGFVWLQMGSSYEVL
jgi:hypothetical protein